MNDKHDTVIANYVIDQLAKKNTMKSPCKRPSRPQNARRLNLNVRPKPGEQQMTDLINIAVRARNKA